MPLSKENKRWLKKKKSKQQFWQVKVFLQSLRLRFVEKDKDTPRYCIEVPLFGMRFKFNGTESPEDAGWKVFLIDTEKIERVPHYFRDDVMWYLVEKGYMAYIRESEHGGNGRVFRSFVIDSGWGTKIIKKRIEMCGNKPENAFMRARMEEFLHVPLPKIVSYYPGFFDYLF